MSSCEMGNVRVCERGHLLASCDSWRWNGLLVYSMGVATVWSPNTGPGVLTWPEACFETLGLKQGPPTPTDVPFPLFGKCHVEDLKSTLSARLSSCFVAKESHLVNDGAYAKWCQRSWLSGTPVLFRWPQLPCIPAPTPSQTPLLLWQWCHTSTALTPAPVPGHPLLDAPPSWLR